MYRPAPAARQGRYACIREANTPPAAPGDIPDAPRVSRRPDTALIEVPRPVPIESQNIHSGTAS